MPEEMIPSEATNSKPKRPLGVWLLTIYCGLFAGLVPLVTVTFAFFNDEGRAVLGLTWVTFGLSVLLAAAILVAAVGAWRGSNIARIAFVVLLTIHYGLWVFNSFGTSMSEGLPESRQMTIAARGVRYLILMGIVIWYFVLSGRTKAFYQGNGDKRPAEAGMTLADMVSPGEDENLDIILSFIQPLREVDDPPSWRYAIWWPADEGEWFQDSPCFRSWDAVYHTMDGIESWVLGILIGTIDPSAIEGIRAKYPATPLRFLLEGSEQQRFILSISQEKGIRFHFDPQQCDPEYRDQFVASYAAFVRALRSVIEQNAVELDPAWEPRALEWWEASKIALRHLKTEGEEPIQFFGVALVGDKEAQ